ncbi:hypothetical protein D0N42_11335, partial [Micrococcus luteus]
SNTFGLELELTEGMRFDKGYISGYFVTDADRQEAVLEDPYILRREADSEKSSGGPRRPSGPGAEPLRPRDRSLGVMCRPPAGARTHTGGARRPPPARCSTRGRLGGGPTSGAQRAAPRCGHGTARADSLTSAPGTRLESCACLRPRRRTTSASPLPTTCPPRRTGSPGTPGPRARRRCS